jgi:hypothetical protein
MDESIPEAPASEESFTSIFVANLFMPRRLSKAPD